MVLASGHSGLIQNNILVKDLVLKCSPTVFYTKTLINSKNIRTNIGINLDQDSLSWPWLMLTGKMRKNNYGASLSSSYTPSSHWFSSMNVSSINFSNPSQIHLYHWRLHYLVTISNYTFTTEANIFCMWNCIYLGENKRNPIKLLKLFCEIFYESMKITFHLCCFWLLLLIFPFLIQKE